MKKYIGWSIIVLMLSIIVMGSWVVYDSRDYFHDLFESKRQKLNLRSEKSVDSLLNVISVDEHKIDSLELVISSSGELTDEKTKVYEKQIKDQQQTITNLKNVIEHQNLMLDELRK